jgi:hypothetical protein
MVPFCAHVAILDTALKPTHRTQFEVWLMESGVQSHWLRTDSKLASMHAAHPVETTSVELLIHSPSVVRLDTEQLRAPSTNAREAMVERSVELQPEAEL